MSRAGTTALWLTVSLLSVTCGRIDGPDGGDETHFQNCETDDDCRELGAGYSCIAGQCRLADGSAASDVEPIAMDDGGSLPRADGSTQDAN